MQPEHIEENSDSAAPREYSANNSQTQLRHGFLSDSSASSASLLFVPSNFEASSGEADTDHGSSGDTELSHTESRSDDQVGSSHRSGPQNETMEGPQTPARRLVDRINEYESMGYPSPLAGRETGFIVKKTDWTGREDSPISEFPSEILLHSLSFLDPLSLLNVALVSRRFHDLLHSQAAWRTAFTKYFPSASGSSTVLDTHESTALSSSQDRRYFTRLSASLNGNAWRKEYILRTLLLRSLARGKRAAGMNFLTPGHSQGTMIITYLPSAGLNAVTHLAAKFGPKAPRIVHGSSSTGIVTASLPITGQLEHYPRGTGISFVNLQQARLGAPGYDVATDMGVEAVMDISEENGWVYGENIPNGSCYIHPHSSPWTTENNSGRFVDFLEKDGPNSCYTAVWIARKKHTGIVETTGGKVWVITGNSKGVLSFFETAYATNRLVKPKKFYLSPGVPIVQIKVDDDFSAKRRKAKMPWIMVINALGEVYYLRKEYNVAASFQIISHTRRKPTIESKAFIPGYDEYNQIRKHGSISDPRDLQLMVASYSKVKQVWENWSMGYFVDVDWPGLNIMVGTKVRGDKFVLHGVKDAKAEFKRFSMVLQKEDKVDGDFVTEIAWDSFQTKVENASIFGGSTIAAVDGQLDLKSTMDLEAVDGQLDLKPIMDLEAVDEWEVTEFKSVGKVTGAITATAMDMSLIVVLPDEDSPLRSDSPGGNARLYAVGTTTGSVFIWNIRSTPVYRAGKGGVDNREIEPEFPQRIIHTDSPHISTIALSSLYLAHGGNDGLVQFWDPLASVAGPIRTINQKFAQKARRRMGQAEEENIPDELIGENHFAARCLTLDPDATSLKGVVVLGTHIRYWNFPSLNEDWDVSKRKKKYSGRKARSDVPPPARVKGDIKAAINDETKLHNEETLRKAKEREELETRYGIARGSAAWSEEEMIQYATMISQETYERESSREDVSAIAGNAVLVTDISPPESTDDPFAPCFETSLFDGIADDEENLQLAYALKASYNELAPSERIMIQLEDSKRKFRFAEAGPSNTGTPGSSSGRISAIASPPPPEYQPYTSDSPPGSPLYHTYPFGYYSPTAGSPPKGQSRSPKRKWQPLPLEVMEEWPSLGGASAVGRSTQWQSLEEEEFARDLERAMELSLREAREGGSDSGSGNGSGKGKGKGKGKGRSEGYV
ncbi:hypothetical protein RUND412_008189 [Rhizina undulata]